MTYRPRASCKRCGARRSPELHISRGGNCPDCGREALVDNLEALHRHSGAYWVHYLDGLTAAVSRLWGETLALDEMLDVTDQGTPAEEAPWPPGSSPHPAPATTQTPTSSSPTR